MKKFATTTGGCLKKHIGSGTRDTQRLVAAAAVRQQPLVARPAAAPAGKRSTASATARPHATETADVADVTAIRTLCGSEVYPAKAADGSFYTLKSGKCPRIGREHNSNHVRVTVDRLRGTITLGCHDDECKADVDYPWPVHSYDPWKLHETLKRLPLLDFAEPGLNVAQLLLENLHTTNARIATVVAALCGCTIRHSSGKWYYWDLHRWTEDDVRGGRHVGGPRRASASVAQVHRRHHV